MKHAHRTTCFFATVNSRTAFTLVELIAAIGVSSIVLGAIGTMLHGVWRLNNSMSHHRVMLDSIGRLAEQFRTDVHMAKSAEVVVSDAKPSGNEPPPQEFVIMLSDAKRIVYQQQHDAITRTVFAGDQTLQREMYALPADTTVSWLVESDEARMLISYPRGAQPPELAERRQLRIDAAIGISPQQIQLNRRAP